MLDDVDLNKVVLLCVAFIGLNILGARLTEVALRLGGYEINPLLGARLTSSMAFKGLISAAIALTLVIFKRGALLKLLNLGMLIICAWNGLAVWSLYVGSS